MALILTSGPAVEPVLLTEAKAHLRLDGDDEDDLVAGLIATARIHLETRLGRAFIAQQWDWLLDTKLSMPVLLLPLAPAISVDVVTLYDEDGNGTDLDSSYIFFDGVSEPPRLIWRHPWPNIGALRAENGVRISFTAGYGSAAGDVPQQIRQAILLLAAHWYENREPVRIGSTPLELPHTITALTGAYRRVRL